MEPNVVVDVAGIKLRNPTMLAAGILGLSSASLQRVWEAGAGAVVTKSLGLRPREGYSNPTVVDVGCGLLNAMGLPNPGVDEFVEEVREVKGQHREVIIIGSVFGSSTKEFTEIAGVMDEAGVDAIELNVSCPHVQRVGLEIGQDPVLLRQIVTSVQSVIDLPVFTKLSPNTPNIKAIATTIEQAGGDGIVATNTLRAMAIDVETGRPILGNRVGGLSGPALKPVALRCVFEIAQSVNIPVIGCGGIMDWKDAVEYLYAGARAIQIGSAIAYRDLQVFQEVVTGIQGYLERKGVQEIGEIVGLSHKY